MPIWQPKQLSPKVADRQGMPVLWLYSATAVADGAGDVPDIERRVSNGVRTAGATWVDGRRGPKLRFDGVGYVSVPSSPAFSVVSGDLTASVIVRPKEYWSFNCIFSKGIAGRELGIFLNGPISLDINIGDQEVYNPNLPVGFPVDEEHELTIVRSGLNVKAYRDGQPIWSTAFSSLGTAVYPSDPFVLGRSLQDAGTPWKGDIDNLRIWNYALSDAEVRREYENPDWRLRGPDSLHTLLGVSIATGPVPPNAANVSGSLGSLSLAAVGGSVNPAGVNGTTGRLDGFLAGSSVNPGIIAGSAGSLGGSVISTATNPGSVAGSLGSVAGSVIATAKVPGTVSGNLGRFGFLAYSDLVNLGSVAGSLGGFRVEVFGSSANPGTVAGIVGRFDLRSFEFNSGIVVGNLGRFELRAAYEEPVLFGRELESFLAATLGIEVWQGALPANAEFPALVYNLISFVRPRKLGSSADKIAWRCQFDAYSESPWFAEKLAEELRQAFEGFRGKIGAAEIAYASPISPRTGTTEYEELKESDNEGIHRRRSEYRIWVKIKPMLRG